MEQCHCLFRAFVSRVGMEIRKTYCFEILGRARLVESERKYRGKL